MVAEYNGTTGTADAGYSTNVNDLNIFYDVGFEQHCIHISP